MKTLNCTVRYQPSRKFFGVIDNLVVLEGTKITQRDSRSSRMDANGWGQIMISRDYGDAGNDLRKATALLIKKICIEEIDDSSVTINGIKTGTTL